TEASSSRPIKKVFISRDTPLVPDLLSLCASSWKHLSKLYRCEGDWWCLLSYPGGKHLLIESPVSEDSCGTAFWSFR
ncbi:Bile acid-CoA:amino acid N-acyltransferase, partial [Dissostichus eleginoides]